MYEIIYEKLSVDEMYLLKDLSSIFHHCIAVLFAKKQRIFHLLKNSDFQFDFQVCFVNLPMNTMDGGSCRTAGGRNNFPRKVHL